MMKMMMIVALVGSIGACGKSKDPKDACEAIYKKGDGEKSYATDKTKFMEACQKVGDETRRCLQLSGSESFKDEACGPGKGNTFRESMELMQLGQGK